MAADKPGVTSSSDGTGADLTADNSTGSKTGSMRVFIGLGANLGEPEQQIRNALACLAQHEQISGVLASSFYATQPMGPQDQPGYVNAVCVMQTELAALELLDVLQAIEQQQGRVRNGKRWGARTLDLDLLLFGDEIIENDRLTVPHPGVCERSFVLLPLLELAPDLTNRRQGASRRLSCQRRNVRY